MNSTAAFHFCYYNTKRRRKEEKKRVRGEKKKKKTEQKFYIKSVLQPFRVINKVLCYVQPLVK